MKYNQADYDAIQYSDCPLSTKALIIQSMLEEDGRLKKIVGKKTKKDDIDSHLKDEKGLYRIELIGGEVL